jgi:hypothetical protein
MASVKAKKSGCLELRVTGHRKVFGKRRRAQKECGRDHEHISVVETAKLQAGEEAVCRGGEPKQGKACLGRPRESNIAHLCSACSIRCAGMLPKNSSDHGPQGWKGWCGCLSRRLFHHPGRCPAMQIGPCLSQHSISIVPFSCAAGQKTVRFCVFCMVLLPPEKIRGGSVERCNIFPFSHKLWHHS